MGPLTWKEILKKVPAVGPVEDTKGHRWTSIGSTGGKKFFVRRIDAGYKSASVGNTPKIIHYKCSKCGIKASKRPGLEDVLPDEHEHRELTCDEVIVKDIIV